VEFSLTKKNPSSIVNINEFLSPRLCSVIFPYLDISCEQDKIRLNTINKNIFFIPKFMSKKILILLGNVGSFTLLNLQKVGEIAIFTSKALKHCFTPPFYPKLILRQFLQIGYFSLPVVGLTAIFSGAVLALQSYSGFSRFNAESTIATVVVLSITRELGPVLAGLMVAGRVGASMSAAIGTMRVTEQIDALTTLSTNPIKYLVAPRIIAAVISMPLLVLIADIIGVMGGYLVSVHSLGFSSGAYISSTFKFLETIDVVSGLVKSAFFGFVIAIMGCYFGYNSKGGAEGVGIATTNAVVASSIMILLLNYIITGLFFG
jgi:phospholipid/cholesterol/gamma-HCH transport system permease protein